MHSLGIAQEDQVPCSQVLVPGQRFSSQQDSCIPETHSSASEEPSCMVVGVKLELASGGLNRVMNVAKITKPTRMKIIAIAMLFASKMLT